MVAMLCVAADLKLTSPDETGMGRSHDCTPRIGPAGVGLGSQLNHPFEPGKYRASKNRRDGRSLVAFKLKPAVV